MSRGHGQVLGQRTNGILPFDERFEIGTELLARALNSAEFAGDAGAGEKAEMRGRLPFLSTRFGEPTSFGYSDYSATWQHNLAAEKHAATAGLGMA